MCWLLLVKMTIYNYIERNTSKFKFTISYTVSPSLLAFIFAVIHSHFIQQFFFQLSIQLSIIRNKPSNKKLLFFFFVTVECWGENWLLLCPVYCFSCVTEIESKACSNIKLSSSGQVIAKVAEFNT